MKKVILLLLLLPSGLIAQNNSIAYFCSENPLFENNYTSSKISQSSLSNRQSSSINEITNKNSIDAPALEIKTDLSNADLLNFHFECGCVKWATASETNCSHFLIMFSRDSKSWNILGQIYGAGNSSAMNNYKYPTDLFEVYFKIYQMDFNGSAKEYGPIFGTCKKQKKTT